MKFNIVGYLLGEGIRNTFKNKKSTLSAMLVMVISMLIFGLFFILGENVNHIMKTVADTQAIQVFIKLGATDTEVKDVGEKLAQIEGIEKVDFMSKEELLDEYMKSLGEQAYVVESLKDENFLSDSYVVTLKDLKLANQVEQQINELDNIKKITASNATISKLVSVTNGIRIVTAIILLGLVIASLFIISNTIKLTVYARRKEISIMKYVGATNSFIRGPFIVEGIIIGIISAIITIGIIGVAYTSVLNKMLASSVMQSLTISLYTFNQLFVRILVVYLILGIGIGVLGSVISMRKYLKV